MVSEHMASTEKQTLLEELVKTIEGKDYIFFGRFSRLSVNDFGELRRKVEKVSNRSVVAKNSIARRALEQLGLKNACEFLKGSMFLTLGEKEPQVISKTLVDFAKGNENFQIAGACVEGGVYPAAYVEQLAKLPSRDVLIASVVGGISAPLRGFVNALSQLTRSLVVVLDQVQKQKASQAS